MPVDPLTVASWNAAFYAESPGFAPPANGAQLPSAPTNQGDNGNTFTITAPTDVTWLTDWEGTGKAAVRFGASGGRLDVDIAYTNAARTLVAVGNIRTRTGAQQFLVDTNYNSGRSLIRCASNSLWHIYSGSSSYGNAADLDPHLFIAEFDDGVSKKLWVDGVLQIDSADETVTGSGTQFNIGGTIGATSGDGVDIHFAAIIDEALTSQQRADLVTFFDEVFGSATSGAATYELSAVYPQDSDDDNERTFTVDATGSVGAVTLTQTSGPTVTIDSSANPVFTFPDPGGTGAIGLLLEAAGTGGGDEDSKTITIQRSSGTGILPETLTLHGGDPLDITNWG